MQFLAHIHVLKCFLNQVFDYCKDLVSSEGGASSPELESILTALGCIAEVLPNKAAVQLRSVVASVVVKQVIKLSCYYAIKWL